MRRFVENIATKPPPQFTFYTTIPSQVVDELRIAVHERDHWLLQSLHWGFWNQYYSWAVAKEVHSALSECTCCARHQSTRPALPPPTTPVAVGEPLLLAIVGEEPVQSTPVSTYASQDRMVIC